MNGSLGTLLPSSVPPSLSAAVSPEDERSCALFSVGDEHAAVSRAASPAPIKVLLSTLVGSCPLPGLLWLAGAWSVIISACLLECATRSDAQAVGRRAELGISDSGWRRREASERTQAVVLLRGRSYLSYSGMLRVSLQC